MNKFLLIFKIVLRCSLIFLLAFIWCRYFIGSLWICLISSFFITLFIEGFIWIFYKKKNIKENLKLYEKEQAENIFLSLTAEKDYLNIFLELVKTRHKNAFKYDDFIEIKHDDNNKVILFPFLKFENLQIDDIALILKKCNELKPNKIVILCNEYDKITQSFIKNFDIEIILLDKYETYKELYKEYEFFPEIKLKYKKETKKTIKDLLAYSFNKTKTKGYIISALILLLSSLFVKMNLYYYIISSLLLIFALISYTNPKYNSQQVKELL